MSFKIILPDYTLQQETQSCGTRHYTLGKNKYPSVTTIIGKFEDKSWLRAWKKRVGQEEAEKVRFSSSRLGTRVHSLNEKILKREAIDFSKYDKEELNRHQLFYPFLEQVEPLLVEHKVYWQNLITSDVTGQDVVCRFAGTPDLVGNFIKPELLGLEGGGNSNKPLLFLGDYKNWKSSKQADALLKAYLQLSAYTAAVNQLTGGEHKLQQTFVLGSSPRKLHIFYLNPEKVYWYWCWFKRILLAYFDPGNHSFNWNEFKQASVGYKKNPDYVDEETTPDVNKWITEEKNYLADKLSL